MGLFSDIVGGLAGAAQGYFSSGGNLAGAVVGGLGGSGLVQLGGGQSYSAAIAGPVMAAAPPIRVPSAPAPRTTVPSSSVPSSAIGALLRTVASRMGLSSLSLGTLMGFVRRFGAGWLIGSAYVTANELMLLMSAHHQRARRKSSRAYTITASQMRKTRSTIRKLHRMHCLLREVAGSAGSGGGYVRRRRMPCRPRKKICA